MIKRESAAFGCVAAFERLLEKRRDIFGIFKSLLNHFRCFQAALMLYCTSSGEEMPSITIWMLQYHFTNTDALRQTKPMDRITLSITQKSILNGSMFTFILFQLPLNDKTSVCTQYFAWTMICYGPNKKEEEKIANSTGLTMYRMAFV